MVDVETLGINPRAGIWQIGAVDVDSIEKNSYIGYSDTIYPDLYLGVESFHPEVETLKWQRSTNRDNYLKALTNATEQSPIAFITAFHRWLTLEYGDNCSNVEFWSQGDFDRQHLEYCFSVANLPIPWKYYQWRDLRTLCAWYNSRIPKDAGSHDAWTDALRQAKHLLKLDKLNQLKSTN